MCDHYLLGGNIVNRKKISGWMRKHPRIFYLFRCLKGFRNKNFITDVNRINESNLVLNFQTYGEKNPDKNIYYIRLNSPHKGFFSMFLLVLDALVVADQYHLTPAVEYGNKSLYYENDKINGSRNPFEYYYEPVSDVNLSEIMSSYRVLHFIEGHRLQDYNKQVFVASARVANDDENSKKYIQDCARVCSKYICLNEPTAAYINSEIKKVLGDKKTLGIHVRGTDFNVGYYMHAKAVPVDQFFQAIDSVMDQYGFSSIFLATDESKTIQKFIEKYGDKVKYYSDTFRSEDGKAVHFSQDNRKHHKYYLGLEVLRDVMTLSYCDGFIAGLSNVSLAARIIKTSRGEKYDYLNIINNGFNTSGQVFSLRKQ